MSIPTIAAWRELSSYLDQALDLEGEALQSWLEALRKRQPSIATQVSDCLSRLADLKRNRFLESVMTQPLPATLEGQQLGAYILKSHIGHGGMGTVWLGQRADGRYDGKAAVKLLNPALVGHPSAARFAREGSVLARLQHPNIAHLLDAGVASTGQPYLVLEYVEGEHIDQYCAHQELDLRQRIELFLDVLAAVAHAHSSLIVHRDLKPSNILVTHNGVVKLLDFGVAALLSPETHVPSTRLTVFGAAALTPGYAAPEQLCDGPITTATDVYALGVLLFVLLTGRHPLLTRTVAAQELVRLTLETEPPRASEVAVDVRQRRLLRGDLDNIMSMALRHTPAERYATVELLSRDLQRYLASEPVLACSQPLHYRVHKFVRRHRVGVAAALTIAFVLIGGIIGTTLQMLEARRQLDASALQAQRVESLGGFVSALIDAVACSRRSSSECNRITNETIDATVASVEKRYANDPAFVGRLLLHVTDQFGSNPDLTILQRVYDLGRSAGDRVLMGVAQCYIVETLERTNRPAEATQRLAEAKSLLGRGWRATPLANPKCLEAEALVEIRRGEMETAVKLLRSAIGVLQSPQQTHDSRYPGLLLTLQTAYVKQGNISAALEITRTIEPAYKAAGLDRTVMTYNAGLAVAGLLDASGEPRAALAEVERVSRQLQADAQADVIDSSGWLQQQIRMKYASILIRLGRMEQVDRVLAGSLRETRKADRPEALLSALFANIEAGMRGRCLECADLLKEVQATMARMPDKDWHNYEGWVEMTRAELEHDNERMQEASEHISKALDILNHGSKWRSWSNLPKALRIASKVAQRQGMIAEARNFATEALEMSERKARGPDTSGDVGEALLQLAQVRLTEGGRGEAKRLLKRAVRCLTNGYDANHPATIEASQLLTRLD